MYVYMDEHMQYKLIQPHMDFKKVLRSSCECGEFFSAFVTSRVREYVCTGSRRVFPVRE